MISDIARREDELLGDGLWAEGNGGMYVSLSRPDGCLGWTGVPESRSGGRRGCRPASRPGTACWRPTGGGSPRLDRGIVEISADLAQLFSVVAPVPRREGEVAALLGRRRVGRRGRARAVLPRRGQRRARQRLHQPQHHVHDVEPAAPGPDAQGQRGHARPREPARPPRAAGCRSGGCGSTPITERASRANTGRWNPSPHPTSTTSRPAQSHSSRSAPQMAPSTSWARFSTS